MLFKDPFKPFGMNPLNFSSVLEVIFFQSPNKLLNWEKGHGNTEFFFHISTTKLPVSEQNLVYEVTPLHFADCSSSKHSVITTVRWKIQENKLFSSETKAKLPHFDKNIPGDSKYASFRPTGRSWNPNYFTKVLTLTEMIS